MRLVPYDPAWVSSNPNCSAFRLDLDPMAVAVAAICIAILPNLQMSTFYWRSNLLADVRSTNWTYSSNWMLVLGWIPFLVG